MKLPRPYAYGSQTFSIDSGAQVSKSLFWPEDSSGIASHPRGSTTYCHALYTADQILEAAAKVIEADLYPTEATDYQRIYNAGVRALAEKVRGLK